jgi:hypothetical protein
MGEAYAAGQLADNELDELRCEWKQPTDRLPVDRHPTVSASG